MQAENILAKNISAAGRKSSYDAACKRLLANKIILAWIMNPPENRRNTITRYSIHEENIVGNVHEIPQNYDLLSAIIICLSDSEQEADSGVLKLLEVLLSPTREAAEKKQILQDDFHIKMTRKLEKEVSTMCNLSKGIEEIRNSVFYSISHGNYEFYNGRSNECPENSKNRAGTIYKEIETEIDLYKKFLIEL